MTYQRNARMEARPGSKETAQAKAAQPAAAEGEVKPKEMVKIDGYQQVLDMLRIADDEFRRSLLARLSRQAPDLAAALKKELAQS